jgi:hypothetical protein
MVVDLGFCCSSVRDVVHHLSTSHGQETDKTSSLKIALAATATIADASLGVLITAPPSNEELERPNPTGHMRC